MSSPRVWLFRVLVAGIVPLMILSFLGPWWTADVNVTSDFISPSGLRVFSINVYQWGIPESEGSEHFTTEITPYYQVILAYTFLSLSILLIFISTFLKGRKGQWLLGIIGLIWIGYALIAVFWIATTTGEYGISLQGFVITQQPAEAEVNSSLRFWYFLAYAAGVLSVGLALFRRKITGLKT